MFCAVCIGPLQNPASPRLMHMCAFFPGWIDIARVFFSLWGFVARGLWLGLPGWTLLASYRRRWLLPTSVAFGRLCLAMTSVVKPMVVVKGQDVSRRGVFTHCCNNANFEVEPQSPPQGGTTSNQRKVQQFEPFTKMLDMHGLA